MIKLPFDLFIYFSNTLKNKFIENILHNFEIDFIFIVFNLLNFLTIISSYGKLSSKHFHDVYWKHALFYKYTIKQCKRVIVVNILHSLDRTAQNATKLKVNVNETRGPDVST